MKVATLTDTLAKLEGKALLDTLSDRVLKKKVKTLGDTLAEVEAEAHDG